MAAEYLVTTADGRILSAWEAPAMALAEIADLRREAPDIDVRQTTSRAWQKVHGRLPSEGDWVRREEFGRLMTAGGRPVRPPLASGNPRAPHLSPDRPPGLISNPLRNIHANSILNSQRGQRLLAELSQEEGEWLARSLSSAWSEGGRAVSPERVQQLERIILQGYQSTPLAGQVVEPRYIQGLVSGMRSDSSRYVAGSGFRGGLAHAGSGDKGARIGVPRNVARLAPRLIRFLGAAGVAADLMRSSPVEAGTIPAGEPGSLEYDEEQARLAEIQERRERLEGLPQGALSLPGAGDPNNPWYSDVEAAETPLLQDQSEWTEEQLQEHLRTLPEIRRRQRQDLGLIPPAEPEARRRPTLEQEVGRRRESRADTTEDARMALAELERRSEARNRLSRGIGNPADRALAEGLA